VHFCSGGTTTRIELDIEAAAKAWADYEDSWEDLSVGQQAQLASVATLVVDAALGGTDA
jgi:hypothetical protein